jgi:hypothetical protein
VRTPRVSTDHDVVEAILRHLERKQAQEARAPLN